jgi:glucose/arabinose dehydrogenase
MKKASLLLTAPLVLGFFSHSIQALDLDKLSLPEGFKISVYAENVENARQMALGENGTVFVGSRGAGLVHAVVDTDKDGTADKVVQIASGLTMPSGVAVKDGDLYVAAINKVFKYSDIESNYGDKPKAETVIDDLPSERHHGWKNIGFGPDGWLYIPVGTPCNVCQTKGGDKFDDEIYDSIVKYDVDTKKRKFVARGVRNSVGFDWHPKTQEFWFTDNGRDWLGDELPPCEINHVTTEGEHFGYPYFHGGVVADPEFGVGKKVEDYKQPAMRLGAHVAPLGIHFYNGGMFPKAYKNKVLVAEHGSWNRSNKVGYRVMMADVAPDERLGSELSNYQPFITGFLQGDDVIGRPVAFLPMPDGSLLISDDFANAIYRVSYSK